MTTPSSVILSAQQLPKVRTLDALDPFTWHALEMMLSFPNTRQTAESLAQTAMYREQAQRRESIAKPMDYAAMMASLALRVRFGRAKAADLDRVSELVQRTNQFNTTTVRYSRTQLQRFLQSPDRSHLRRGHGGSLRQSRPGSRCYHPDGRGSRHLRLLHHELPSHGI